MISLLVDFWDVFWVVTWFEKGVYRKAEGRTLQRLFGEDIFRSL
jgi:hypothetical protein